MHMALWTLWPVALSLLSIILSTARSQQQPWSPIVGGRPVIPPTLPPSVTLIHSEPKESVEVITKSLPRVAVKSLHASPVKSLESRGRTTPVKSLHTSTGASLRTSPVKSFRASHVEESENPSDKETSVSGHTGHTGHTWTVPHRSRARRKKWKRRSFRRPALREYRVYNSPYRDSPYRDTPYRDSPYRDSPYRDSPYRDSPYRDTPYRDTLYRDSQYRDSPSWDRWSHYGGRGRGKVRQYRGVDNRYRPVNQYRSIDSSYRSADTRRQDDEGRSFVRNLFGSPNHCLEEGRQYSCTFTPVCWLTGGVASTGCDSWMYSCCRPPSIGRKDKDVFEKRTRDLLENEPECGISRHRQFSKRIIGGEKAKFAELPWQAHIRISSYQCGGVLLNHWYVATAAHCVHRAKLHKISVHLGEYDTKDTEDTEEPLDSHSYKVDHIIIHPDFRYMLTQPDRYDVALLHLDRPVFYQDNIIPICLPPGDIGLYGKVGIVAGWGKTDNSFGKTGTNILHKVLVPIIKNNDCIRWHEDKNILVQLHSEMFCAGHKKGKMDACLGDSGGPLVIHYNGRWTLIGITSAGFGCAVDKQPGIYHKIGKTTHWILTQINP